MLIRRPKTFGLRASSMREAPADPFIYRDRSTDFIAVERGQGKAIKSNRSVA
ncbi:hypothetical protein WN982_00950 [Paraburkholderia sp. IMGN_8]|uniref:hypothetical protein n=1 Tax=Paraburkholderia sp. IMGN_8 TaxID=3136564 RepID=UPI003101A3B5